MAKKKVKKSKWPHFSDDPEVQAHYEACREAGSDHKGADMLASRKAPTVENRYSPLHPRRNRGRGY